MLVAGDTIVAIATPGGEGALGIVRLSGPGSRDVALNLLGLPELKPRTATVATARDQGTAIDQVVATWFPGPASATGEDVVELSAHGSPYILSALLEAALRRGARLAEPGEFTRRAFLNGRVDLAQAEAVGLLIRARTSFAHRAALAQLQGGLSRAVGGIRRDLLGALAVLEAAIDHPDEDLPALRPGTIRAELEASDRRLAALAATHRAGRLAAEGARVSILGRPNVGKSSLLNALLGRDRAIVAAEPGTTRDTLEEAADLGGLRAVLIDTAGLREEREAGEIEREGMRRARRSLESADAALLVLDRSVEWTGAERRLLEEAAAGGTRPVLAVLNKSDLPARLSPRDLPVPAVEVSALRGTGVPELSRRLRETLAAAPAAGEGAPIVQSLRHLRALEEARAALARAADALESPELAAVHLREALAAAGAIVGETTSDEVLGEIFSRFCVGK